MKKNRIKATASFIVECLAAKQYNLLYTLDINHELPIGYVEQTILEYGGAVTESPDKTYTIDVIRHTDIEDSLFVDILLWIDNEPSDLTLQCTLHTNKVSDGRYSFSITEVEIM